MAEESPRKPLMWGLMSGLEAVMTRAFLWCGWEARQPLDYFIDPTMDMRSRKTRGALHRGMSKVDFWCIGTVLAKKSEAWARSCKRSHPQMLR